MLAQCKGCDHSINKLAGYCNILDTEPTSTCLKHTTIEYVRTHYSDGSPVETQNHECAERGHIWLESQCIMCGFIIENRR